MVAQLDRRLSTQIDHVVDLVLWDKFSHVVTKYCQLKQNKWAADFGFHQSVSCGQKTVFRTRLRSSRNRVFISCTIWHEFIRMNDSLEHTLPIKSSAVDCDRPFKKYILIFSWAANYEITIKYLLLELIKTSKFLHVFLGKYLIFSLSWEWLHERPVQTTHTQTVNWFM